MTKASTMIAAGLLALMLAGCATPPQPAPPTTSAPEPAPTVRYKACLMTDAGDAPQGSPVAQAIAGLDRAQQELGIEAQQVAATAASEYPRTLQSLVDSGCQLVIAIGAPMADSVEAAAKTNSQVRFALVDAIPNSTPPNLRPVVFSSHEVGFLAGYLAASRTTTGTVGTFGGLKVPAATGYMDGFAQGVDHFNTEKGTAVALVGWQLDTQDGTFVRSDSQPWNDPAAGRQAAQSLVDQGADVILAVAGESGVGALQLAAENPAVKVIWTDTDGCLTQPDHCAQILGSAIKDRDAAVFELIRADESGRGAAGIFGAALRNDGVALVEGGAGEFGAATTAELESLVKAIIGGTIRVTSAAAIG